MGKLTTITNSSNGNIQETARKVGAKKAFKSSCNTLLVKAYKKLQSDVAYEVTWEEDTFTANMYKVLDEICLDEEAFYMPIYQEHQLTEYILSGVTRPLKAKKIDIVFATFYKPRLKYRIEAKILAECNTDKRNANNLSKEYVVSGIDRFVKKEYEPDGCMIGYIVNGNADSVLKAINLVLTGTNREKEILKGKHFIDEYEFCYDSEHCDFGLKHFLFHFLDADTIWQDKNGIK